MTTQEPPFLPFVSVIVPCRNEEKSIVKCLQSIAENDYPKDRMEIIVADGMSEDKSRDIVSAFLRERGVSFSVVPNPERFTPHALNRGIQHSRGDIVGSVGGHNFISQNYIRGAVAALSDPSVACAGGRGECIPMGETLMARAIAAVMRSRFGIGGSFRSAGGAKKFVDTVPSPFYKKEVFSRIGLFNGKLLRSQDIELNKRLAQSGGKILLDPEIVSYYYDRPTWWTFTRQKFVNGTWSILPFAIVSHMPVSLRHLIPLAFVSGMAGSLLLAFWFPWMLALFFLIFGSYAALALFFSWRVAREQGSLLFPYALLLFFSLHIGYGLGSLWGIIQLLRFAGHGTQ